MQGQVRWVVLGAVVLLVGVVAWRLMAGSYKGDVQRICQAEKNAGLDGLTETHKVETWAKEHTDTPEAAAWFSKLLEKGVSERASGLREETQRLGISECPLVKTYDELRERGELRRDLTLLCGLGAEIEQKDDAERLRAVLDQIRTKSKSPRIKPLADKLEKAKPEERPDIVRATAQDASVFTCELANTLSKPPVKHEDKPTIRIGMPQINGDLTVQQFSNALLTKMEPMLKCYRDGLAKKADLGGRIMLKMMIMPGGKVNKIAAENGTTLPDCDVVGCIFNEIKATSFPATAAPLNAILAPLDLTPNMPPVPADPHGH